MAEHYRRLGHWLNQTAPSRCTPTAAQFRPTHHCWRSGGLHLAHGQLPDQLATWLLPPLIGKFRAEPSGCYSTLLTKPARHCSPHHRLAQATREKLSSWQLLQQFLWLTFRLQLSALGLTILAVVDLRHLCFRPFLLTFNQPH